MTIIQDRLKEIEGKRLYSGSGANIDHACVMQLVSYVAGEPWTDHPKCACPALTDYAITLNDRLPDEQRQALRPLIPLLVGTRGTPEDRTARAKFLVWRSLTVSFPLFLDVIKMDELAAEMRGLALSDDEFRRAKKLIDKARLEIRKRADAAYSADAADADADAAAYSAAAAAYSAYSAADAAAAYSAAAAAAAAAVRKPIDESAIETLRLAIEVKA